MTPFLTQTPADHTPDGDPATETSATSVFRRPRALAVQGAVLALLVGGGTAWFATEKDVTLVVDGESRAVSTHAGDVHGVLAQAGLEVGEHDLLAPGEDAPVEDGSEIVLRRARELTLAVDGQPRTVWVTATDVDEALDQVGIADRAFVSADRSRSIPLEGMALDVRTPKAVTLVDGTNPPTPLETTAADLAGVLGQVGTALRPGDRLSAPLDSAPTAGQQIAITRVERGTRQEVVQIPAGEQRRDDAGLFQGQTKVVDAGQSGELVKDVAWTMENGVEVAAVVTGERVARAASPRVVAVGTKPKPKPKPAPAPAPTAASGGGGGSAPGGSWGAVAKCESGGNPRAVSSTGKYRGLYQFSRETWASVGGSGDPAAASAAEQTARAQKLLARSGAGQWPKCGRHLR